MMACVMQVERDTYAALLRFLHDLAFPDRCRRSPLSLPLPALCLDVQVSIDSQRVTFESQLRDKVRELNDVQAKFDAHSAEMRARYQQRL